MAVNQTDPAYTVTRVSNDVTRHDGGQLVDAYRVDFRTKEGVHSFVRVPRQTGWETDAHKAIEVESRSIEALHGKPIPPTLPKG